MTIAIKLPTKQAAVGTARKQWFVRIISKVFLHPHTCIPQRFVVQILVPGLLRSDLKDHLGSRAALANAPAAHTTMGNTRNDGNIWSQRIFFCVGCLIEIEIVINGVESPMKQPAQDI